MHWPAHFSTVSISSRSRRQQQPKKQARGKTKEDDRRCQAPSRRGSWSREWSYGLRILLLFESTLFSLMYLSWSLQDFLWFIRFNWYLQFVSGKGLWNGKVFAANYNALNAPDFELNSFGEHWWLAPTNSHIKCWQDRRSKTQLLLWRPHAWHSAIGCVKFALFGVPVCLALVMSFKSL